MIVVPAIIPRTREQMEEEIKKVSRFARLVQIDISDGVFTPYPTWPYNGHDTDYFDALKAEEVGWPCWEDVDIEVHLMVSSPENIVEDWIYTGITSLVVHIEAVGDMEKIIDLCRTHNVALSIALKPSTDIDTIAPYVADVDCIQCMGSNALGRHGVELDEIVFEKIEKLHELYPERIISVDIGVTEDTALSLVSAGASKLIVGSAILDADDPEEVFHILER